MTRGRIAVLVAAFTMVASSCSLTKVDAPITVRSDRRLRIVEPEGGDRVRLPVTIRWTARDWEPVGGKRFVLMIDKKPIKPGELLRRQLCTRNDDRPISPGQRRQPCFADRDRVVTTTETQYTFDCIKPRRFTSERQQHVHTALVLFLNEKGERESSAGYSVQFEILEDQRLRDCSL